MEDKWSLIITGENSKRWYLPDAATDQEVRELLEGPTQWVREHISERFPSLKYFRLAAIKTGPNAPSQYAGHNYRLHSDFSDEVSFRSFIDRPLSFMIALDCFEVIYLPHKSLTRDDLVTKVADPGEEVVIFTNNCTQEERIEPKRWCIAFLVMWQVTRRIPSVPQAVGKYCWRCCVVHKESQEANVFQV